LWLPDQVDPESLLHTPENEDYREAMIRIEEDCDFFLHEVGQAWART